MAGRSTVHGSSEPGLQVDGCTLTNNFTLGAWRLTKTWQKQGCCLGHSNHLGLLSGGTLSLVELSRV